MIKISRHKDVGFTSGWRLEWGWVPDRLDTLPGSLAPANHVGSAAAKGR